MAQKPRKIENGQIKCSHCKFPHPLSWFTKDKHTPIGYGYICRTCRKQSNKLKVVFPDFEVISISEVKLLLNLGERMEAGSWERVVARAAIATPNEVIKIYTGRNYLSHHSAYIGILEAARRRKLKLNIQHGSCELYITSCKLKTKLIV